MDDTAEEKILSFLSSRSKNEFSSDWYVVYYQMRLCCVFLNQNVKVILIGTGIVFCKNMAAIKQHAIVEEKSGEGMFFFHFLFPLFMSWLEFKAYNDDPHVL